MDEKVFSMVPGPPAPSIVLWILVLFLAALTLLFFYIACTLNRVKFTVTADGLRIRAPLYGRFIPASVLRKEKIEVIDLAKDESRKPSWRTNGIGLPGYALGWFMLKNNEKALLCLTDCSQVVYIPTTEGFSLLLSVEDTGAFVSALNH
jgi:hypothetical protein